MHVYVYDTLHILLSYLNCTWCHCVSGTISVIIFVCMILICCWVVSAYVFDIYFHKIYMIVVQLITLQIFNTTLHRSAHRPKNWDVTLPWLETSSSEHPTCHCTLEQSGLSCPSWSTMSTSLCCNQENCPMN